MTSAVRLMRRIFSRVGSRGLQRLLVTQGTDPYGIHRLPMLIRLSEIAPSPTHFRIPSSRAARRSTSRTIAEYQVVSSVFHAYLTTARYPLSSFHPSVAGGKAGKDHPVFLFLRVILGVELRCLRACPAGNGWHREIEGLLLHQQRL